MDPALSFRCPCGAPAPCPLPGPGRRPAPCSACATPLVRPGRLPREDLERAVGVALLVASVLAVVWMFAARTTGSSAHVVLPIAGALIGVAARMGARTCGPSVQRTAGFCFVAFVLFGEVLLFRGALLPRLVALHREEGASDAEVLAQREFDGMELTQYLHVELTLTLFVGFAAGLFLALWLTRAPSAVAAFRASAPDSSVPPEQPDPERDPEPRSDDEAERDAAPDSEPEERAAPTLDDRIEREDA